MGRYSSDSDDDYRRSKKKKKRRSRSSSPDSYSSSKKLKKSKKKASKRRSRSRSRSSDRHRRRRSRSRDRRSRSRSKSSERYRKRRSRSRGKRSRSRSRDRRRSRSSSRYQSRRSSRSGSRSRRSSKSRRHNSRSKSPDVYKARRSRSVSKTKEIKQEIKEEEPVDPCKAIPGFDNMTLLEQNELRMQMALKAAAATDERLRQEGLLPGNVGRSMMSVEEQARRSQAINEIQGEAFVQQSFLSNRAQKVEDPTPGSSASARASHENAMFSNLPIKMENGLDKNKKIQYTTDPDLLMGSALYENPEVKMDRWLKKLTAMRRKKLEGEAMS